MSIERAAEETRIRADFLMRMESDEFDFLAPAYVRGFLKSYARFLGLDPEPLIKEFDERFGGGRADTTQIAALERRKRSVPRQRRSLNSWGWAALIAGATLFVLAVVGLMSPEEGRAPAETAARESPTATPTPEASPTPSPSPSPEETLALTEGIEVVIVGRRAECWVSVNADGAEVFTDTVLPGERAGPFSAEERVDIVLGNAYGVELIVNGRRFPSVGGEGEVLTLTLPDDIKRLL